MDGNIFFNTPESIIISKRFINYDSSAQYILIKRKQNILIPLQHLIIRSFMNDTYKRRCPTLLIKGWFCDNMHLWNNNKLLTTHVVVENMQRLICFLTAVHKKISHNVHKVTENHLHLHLLLGILGYILWCWKLLFLRWSILINLEITFE